MYSSNYDTGFNTNMTRQPIRIPYSSGLSPPPMSSSSSASFSSAHQAPSADTIADITILRDRFRLLCSIFICVVFHWLIIYLTGLIAHVLNVGSLEFGLIFNASFVWHTFKISFLVGVIVFLQHRQIQWSQLPTLDQVYKDATVYVGTSTIVYFTCYLILGLFLTTSYLGLYNGGFTSKLDCSGTEGCLNDNYLFIVFSATYAVGVVYINYRTTCGYRLQFPVLLQSSPQTFRHCCSIYFIESSKHVLKNLPLMYLIYYFMGTSFRIWASKSTNLNLGVNLLETFSQFMSIKLFVYVFLTSTFTVGTFKICWEILKLCLTKRRVFPLDIDPILSENDGVTLLPDALRSTLNIYTRNLAFYDLYCMTDKMEKRIEDLFKITYTSDDKGLLWSIILEECLAAIRTTSELIKSFEVSEKKSWSESVKADTKSGDKSTQPIYPRVTLKTVTNSDEASEGETNSLNIRRRGYYPMRQLSPTDKQGEYLNVAQAPLTPIEIFLRGSFSTEKARTAVRNMFRSFRWADFYFKKKLEAQMSVLLSNSQIVILSIQSLMNVVNIYLIQNYANIVQRDLSSIVVALIEFHESMDTLKNMEIPRVPSSTLLMKDNMKSQACAQRSSNLLKTQEHLIRVCTNALLELDYHFHQYFEFMPISYDHQMKLKTIVSNNNFLVDSNSSDLKKGL